MPEIKKREKLNWFLLMIGYFVAGYLSINWLSSHRSFFNDVTIPADTALPFIPAFVFGYILVYLSVLLIYFVVKDRVDWGRTVVSSLMATSVAYIFFVLFPVKMMMRPDLASNSGFSEVVTRFYYMIDLPYNCFPSLHVTYPTLAVLVTWRNHKVMRFVFLGMLLIVATSVVLVKQHYIADVVAGFLNAVICFTVAVKTEKTWSKWFTSNL